MNYCVKRDVIASNAVVKRQHADYVRYGWRKNRSCAVLAARIDGKHVMTLEGLQDEAQEFARYMGQEGSDQCGFCNPGFVMNVLAMARELDNPGEEEIKEYLAGNLCRCTGYVSHMRALKRYLTEKGKGMRL